MKMMLPLLWALLCVLIVLSVFGFRLRKTWRRAVRLTKAGVFLRRVDIYALEQLLDPTEEARIKKQCSGKEFSRAQEERALAALEQMRRIEHNATIFFRLGNSESARFSRKNPADYDDRDLLVVELIKNADHVKRLATWGILKTEIWLWLWLNDPASLFAPSLSHLRGSLGDDVLRAYQCLTATAAELALSHGFEEHDGLTSAY